MMNEDNINPLTGLDSGNNRRGNEPPHMPIDEEANRNSLGDFSHQEKADANSYKKRRYMAGGGIALILVVIAIILGVTLSSKGNNDSSNNNGEEQDTNMMGEGGQGAIVPNDQAEQDVPSLVVDPNIFSINDDEVTYFTHSFSMGSDGPEDDAIYIPVLDNDSPGSQDVGLIVHQIKESKWGPNHGECVISMDLTMVVYTLNDPKFIGSDECEYEACTSGEEDEVCGTAKVIINVEESEDNVENVNVDPSKVISMEQISNEAVQLMLDENIVAKELVVDIWDNTIAIGASNDNNDKGTVLVYVKDPISGEWTQQAKLVAPESETNEEYWGYFGWSVDIYEDTLIVGAFGEGDANNEIFNRGAAHVFVRDAEGDWSYQTKLSAGDGASDDYFGYDVAVYEDVAVVTAWNDDDKAQESGSAYVFMRNVQGVWTEVIKLDAPDGKAEDYFGNSVDLYDNTIIVGAWWDDNEKTNSTNSGSAHVYVRDDDTWVWQAKLQDAIGESEDRFGNRVSLWGDTAVVGARGDDGDSTDAGSVYVFRRYGDSWISEAKLVAPDGAPGDQFGGSVSLYEDHLIVGARYDDDIGSDSGSAHIFVRDGEEWRWVQKLLASEGESKDYFAFSTGIYNGTVVVGSISGETHVYSSYSGKE